MNDKPYPTSADSIADLFAAPQTPEEKALEAWERTAPLPPEADMAALQELARLRTMPVNELVLEYLGNRDRLDEERHRYQAIEADIKGRLATMSMVMREKADALGVDAFPIRGVGTAYRNLKTSYRLNDWDSFIKWIQETQNFQCLEKRVAKLATAEVEKHAGNLPPGIDKIVEVEFLVRRNKA